MILLFNSYRKQIIRLTISEIIRKCITIDDNHIINKKTIRRKYIEENVEYLNYNARKF